MNQNVKLVRNSLVTFQSYGFLAPLRLRAGELHHFHCILIILTTSNEALNSVHRHKHDLRAILSSLIQHGRRQISQ